MNSTDLPPIPKVGEDGPQVCNTVRLYLAVLDDLSTEQVNLLFKHVQTCSTCTAEFQLLNSATRLVEGLGATSPSHRVDAAIMALQFDQPGSSCVCGNPPLCVLDLYALHRSCSQRSKSLCTPC